MADHARARPSTWTASSLGARPRRPASRRPQVSSLLLASSPRPEHPDRQGVAPGRRARVDEPRAGADRQALRGGGELEEALHGETGHDRRLDEDENEVERSLGFNHLLEVYAPSRLRREAVLGAYEIYADPAPWSRRSPRAPRDLGRDRSCSWLSGPRSRCSSAEPRHASPPDARAQGAVARPDGLVPAARGELARGDREPERHRRGEGPLHRRPLAPRAACRGRPRRRARPVPRGLDALRFGALFHDIGKIAVPDAILLKPGS